jgi:ethanolamine utilization protein EutP (predicted NTPase)
LDSKAEKYENMSDTENIKTEKTKAILFISPNTLDAICELGNHSIMVGAVLATSRVLETFIYILWGDDERILFDYIPLKYIFDAFDLAVLSGFSVYGTIEVVKKYIGEK